MARLPRIVVPGQALNIVQRGNNRQTCIFAKADYQFCLDSLTSSSARYSFHVRAHMLMTNRVHLLVRPEKPRSQSFNDPLIP